MSDARLSGVSGVGEFAGGDSAVVDIRGEVRILVDADIYLREKGIYERIVKPVFDVVSAIVILVLVSPVMIACAIAVYRSLGRPILLKQQRVGQGGRVFNVYKFRSMRPDRRIESVPVVGPDRRVSHKRGDDPRLTDVGRFIRKWSIDELPQLFNVIKRDMSLVGPRPELVDIVLRYEAWQHRRHSVKPGITGLWQVTERGKRMLHEATDIDLEYVDELTAFRDLKLMALTPLAALGRRTGF